jgi:carbon-monoxide dehydrogenase medium subunit
MRGMYDFSYYAPTSLSEACRLLSEAKGQAKPLAGGTDLLVQMRQNLVKPQSLVDLKKINQLKGIEYINGQGLRIGALVTHSELLQDQRVLTYYPILSQSAQTIGSVQIRNKGTVGGNLCHAVPSADLAPPLLVLNAQIIIQGIKDKRVIPLDQFFSGPNQTVLKEDEIVEEILVPPLPPRSGAIYLKHGIRRAMEIAIAGVAVLIVLEPDKEKCAEARIALGAVAPTPLRIIEAEKNLKGKKVGREEIDQAATIAATQAQPITDLRGSAEYRREIVKVLTARAIQAAVEKASAS